MDKPRPFEEPLAVPYVKLRWYSHMDVLVTFVGLTKTIGGKRGGSMGVGIEPLEPGVEGMDVYGPVRGVCARGTKPAARMFDDTIQRASTAPCE